MWKSYFLFSYLFFGDFDKSQKWGYYEYQTYANSPFKISQRGSLPYLSADFEVLDPGVEYYENDNNAVL